MKGPTIPEGTIIKGKYRVERRLGVGGMGIVVAAMHLKLEQRVAIKFLLPEMLRHPEIVDRFLKEARAASRIEGDHVARVMDVDVLEDGSPFLVMEYLEGRDLSFVRKSRQPLHAHEAAKYVVEACSAVAEAHQVGIVHRDLKPANLFLAQRRDGSTRVKVLDFGISKVLGALGDDSATKTGSVLGSAEYMSPEQMLASRDVDPRSDIWSLGVILYELCTARLPFRGDSITHVAVLVAGSDPVPAIEIVPTIPVGLDAIIRRCLEKDRERRFANVGELVIALSPFTRHSGFALASPVTSSLFPPPAYSAGNTPLPLTPVPALTGPSTTAGISTGGLRAAPTATRSPMTISPGQIFAICGVTLLGLTVGALLLFRSSRAEPSASATSSAAPIVAPPPTETPALPAPPIAPPPIAPASASAAPSAAPVAKPKPQSAPRPRRPPSGGID